MLAARARAQDIKPYIARYDALPTSRFPAWIAAPPVQRLAVRVEALADAQLRSLFVDDVRALRHAVAVVLARSDGARVV